MKKVLIFVAAGNSTRMGGIPKALLSVCGTPVIINAISCAEGLYDYVYVVSNSQNVQKFKNILNDYNKQAKVVTILSGQGDADAVLKSLREVENDLNMEFDATFCWGDAYFSSSVVFEKVANFEFSNWEKSPILVGCSIDKNPYAYFDILTVGGNWNLTIIKRSYFKKIDGGVVCGIHDQCIFRCKSSFLLNVLYEYQVVLGFDGINYTLTENNEMGLLNSFDYMFKQGIPAQVCLIPALNVFSFNTLEELNYINKIVF